MVRAEIAIHGDLLGVIEISSRMQLTVQCSGICDIKGKICIARTKNENYPGSGFTW